MKIFVVGGAVRDVLLGMSPSDLDYVVVGGTSNEMLALGMTLVGSDFPVFLDKNGDEYALARTERKNGDGYTGFETDSSQTITLEQDLSRRDLTINSMAVPKEEWQEFVEFKNTKLIIDFFGGMHDISQKTLRHTSGAFVEDPVRILRIARFAAKYQFTIASDTLDLMKEMVLNGCVSHLVAERVWLELNKTLGLPKTSTFFEVLRDCGALSHIFPEIDALYGVIQPPKWHPEIDCGIHTMMVLDQVCMKTDDKKSVFAALTHDLGKALTPKERLPSHPGHEENGVPVVEALCMRLKVPNEYRSLAVAVCRYHLIVHKAYDVRDGTIMKTLEGIGYFRKPEVLKGFLDAIEADAKGRLGLENREYPQRNLFEKAAEAALETDISEIVSGGYRGSVIGGMIRGAKIMSIKRVLGKIKKDENY